MLVNISFASGAWDNLKTIRRTASPQISLATEVNSLAWSLTAAGDSLRSSVTGGKTEANFRFLLESLPSGKMHHVILAFQFKNQRYPETTVLSKQERKALFRC